MKTLLGKAKRNDEAALKTLRYFDPLELVPQLRVPVLMSAGGKDILCPQATMESVFKRLPGAEKTLKIYPNLTHTSCVDFGIFTPLPERATRKAFCPTKFLVLEKNWNFCSIWMFSSSRCR